MMSSSTLKLLIVRLLGLFTCCACFATVGFAQTSLDLLLKKLTDPKPAVRIAAVQELSTVWQNDIDAFRPLVAALADADPAVRKYAAMGLRNRRNPRAVPALLTLLKDPNPNIRTAVIDTLQETADPRAVESLIAVWQTDKEERLRNQAFSAICFIADMRATDTLLTMLKDPAHSSLAIRALGSIGDDRAFEPLLAIAKDANHPQRQEALQALEAFGEPRVVDLFLPQLAPGEDVMADVVLNSLDPRAVPYLLKDIETNRWRVGKFRTLHDERAVDMLIRLTGAAGEEQQTRFFAIEALGAIRDRRAVPALVKALQEKTGGNLSLCYAAIQALGSIGDANVVPALLPLLKDVSVPIRFAVVAALRNIQSPLTIDALLTLTKSPDYFMRNDAYYALACIPDARAVQIVVTMLLTLQENLAGSGWDEENFFTALAENPRMTADHYLSILRNSHNMSIFQALAHTPIRNQLLFDAMIQWLVDNGDYCAPDVALSQALLPYGKAATDALLAQVTNPETNSSMIITMLGEIGDQRAIPPLMRIFENNSSSDVIIALGKLAAKDITPQFLKIARSTDQALITQQWAALESLGALKEQSAFDLLVAASQKHPGDTSVGRRVSAASGLGKLGDIRAVEPLIDALRDDDNRVYTAATLALLQLPPDPRTIEPLLDILHDAYSSDMQGRVYAAQALARFPEERILFEFCQTLQRPSLVGSTEQIRRSLAHLLGLRKDPRAVRSLTRCLNYGTGDPGVAAEAAWALGQIGDARAIPALMNVVNDANPGVRTAATAALQLLTGEDFGANHARWVAWWIATKEMQEQR